MKKIVAWPLAYACYFLGDITCKLMRVWEPLGKLYPVYNKLMIASYRLDGWADLGLWSAPE